MRCSNGCAGTSSTTAPTPTVRTSGARRVRPAPRRSSSAAGAAVLVLHHRPKHRPGYRGSSVRRDRQTTVAAEPRGGCAAQGAEEGSHAPRALDTASGWALATTRRWRGVACTFGVGAHRLLGQRHGLAETRRPEQAFAGRQRGTSVQAEHHLHLKPTGLGGAKGHAVAEPQHPNEPEPWT